MDNKILILLMSCNQPLYEQEEQACRDTFLKDTEKAGIQYYFYKGVTEEHPELFIDEENNTMYLPVPDGLGGTSRKTLLALNEALKFEGWDYVIKTNVSTWLDIKRICKAVEQWEGSEDRNVYGARFLANDASKKVPFPRGHFMIISRALVDGVVKWAPSLIVSDKFPRTDDTLMCLALLYHIQKILEDNYVERLKEVPSVTNWIEDIQEAKEWPDAFSVRCKDESNGEKTPENMLKVHALKRSTKVKRKCYRPMGVIETKYGLMTYESFQKVAKAMEKKATEPQPAQQPPQQANQSEQKEKMLDIRRKLDAIMKGKQ